MGKRGSFYSFLLGTGMLCGCSVLSPTVTVELRLPPLPPAWRQSSGNGNVPATVVYENSYGEICRKEFPYGNAVAVEIVKKENTAVLVYPAASMRPCGGFFDGSRTMELSWKGGFLAEALMLSRQPAPEHWNPAALTERMEGNPWFYETAAILKALETGTVGRYTLKKKMLYPVLLKEIPPGDWINRYPHERVTIDESGEFRTELPIGYERYVNTERKQILSLYVNESGPVPFMLTEFE